MTHAHSSGVLKDIHLGQQIQSYAKKVGLSSNVFVGSAVLDLYAKLSSLDDALRAFGDINGPNVFSFATLIRAFTKEERFDEAEAVFRSMTERNVVCRNTMICGSSQSGKNEEAVNPFMEMLREGVTLIQSLYACAIIAAANIGSIGLGRSIHASAVKRGSPEDSVNLKQNTRKKCNFVECSICDYAQNGEGNAALDMYNKMGRR